MDISTKHRRWLMGAALLLTIAATASVNSQDDPDTGVVQAVKSKVRAQHPQPEHLAEADPGADILMDKLKRPAMPEEAMDMFAAGSWYVPPPPPRVPPRPSAPPVSFVYIGKMQEGNDLIVFLERQSRIYMVREGDAIDASYRVDEIKAPVMTLTYLPLDIKQTMQIGEAN